MEPNPMQLPTLVPTLASPTPLLAVLGGAASTAVAAAATAAATPGPVAATATAAAVATATAIAIATAIRRLLCISSVAYLGCAAMRDRDHVYEYDHVNMVYVQPPNQAPLHFNQRVSTGFRVQDCGFRFQNPLQS